MEAFPTRLRPSVSQGYGFDAPNNVLNQAVQGGAPLRMLDYSNASKTYNLNLVTSNLGVQVFQDFYYGKVSSGADSFELALDDNGTLENKVVSFINESITFDFSREPIITINFSVKTVV